MNKKTIATVLFVIVLLAVLVFLGKVFIIDRRANAFSGLKVDSIPQAEVFLNDKKVGTTPYENSKIQPGEYTLKLVAVGSSETHIPWAGKIKLVPQGLTYVNRSMAATESESGHQIVWLEKTPDKTAKELAVVSSPDNAQIIVDGLDVGATSKIISNLSAGDHTITISKEGFSDAVINGKILPAYRLNIFAKLAKADSVLKLEENTSTESAKISTPSGKIASESATADNPEIPYILVKETGLGFLRVRSGPSVAATMSGQVNVGEKFPLLQEKSGWSEIKMGTASGWVSDQYIQKFK